jgi:hypothetical protein
MDSLSKFGVPFGDNKRGGIICPQSAYRFRIVPLSHSIGTMFMSNIEKCDINMKDNKFTIKVRQPILVDFLYELEKIIKYCREFRLDFLDGGDGIHSAMQFQRCNLLHSHFSVDYAVGGHIIHTLEYQYDDFIILTPNIEDAKPTPKAPGDLTPEEALELMDKENEKGQSKSSK